MIDITERHVAGESTDTQDCRKCEKTIPAGMFKMCQDCSDPSNHRPMYPDADDWTGIKNKIEGIHSVGGVVCDVCRDMDPDTRPNYTTKTPYLHIDVTGRTLGDWLGASLCHVHRDATTEGTHVVECRMEPVESDKKRHRGRYSYGVVAIREK